jgi:hypothetical protein
MKVGPGKVAFLLAMPQQRTGQQILGSRAFPDR